MLTVAVTAVAAPARRATTAPRPSSLFSTPVAATKAARSSAQLLKARKAPARNLHRAHTGAMKPVNTASKIKRADAAGGNFYGALVYSTAWTDNYDYSIVSLPTAGGDPTAVSALPSFTTSWYADGKYYCYGVQSFWGFYLGTTMDVYDTATWDNILSVDVDVPEMVLLDFKQNPADGKVYGIASDMQQIMWGTIDLESFTFTPIASGLDWAVYGLIIKNNKGYGITQDGTLLEITLATGQTSYIGETGQATQYLTSALLDEATGRMIYAPYTDDASRLVSIDLTTAESTDLYTFTQGEEFTGFFAPRYLAPGTPDMPTDLTFVLDGESLTFNVSFTAPASDAQGNPLEGDLNYVVNIGGQTIIGTVAPGATALAPVTVAEAGYYSVRVTVSNAAGESYGASYQGFVGPDELGNVSNVLLTDNGAGSFTLTWNAAKAVHGGYIDASQLTYTVTDRQGGMVAEGLTATELQIPYTEPEGTCGFQYSVAAVYKGVPYQAVSSNTIVKGSVEPPFSCTFDSGDDMNQFTVIDANGDGTQWHHDGDSGAAQMSYNMVMDMDDWLILPGIRMQGGKAYKFSVDVWCYGADYPERVEVLMGNGMNPADMTTVLVAPTDVADYNRTTCTAMINAAADGVYYIGIHGISDADRYVLYVDDISVSAAIAADVPMAVTNVTATPDPNGALSATVSFTTPTAKVSGEAVGTLNKATVSRADGTVVGTVDAPEAGCTYSVTDTVAPAGNVTYSVVVTGEGGDSEPVTATVFVGFTVPAAVQYINAVESSTGNVTLSWPAVTADANGMTLPVGGVTYTVYQLDGDARVKIAEGLTEPTYTHAAVAQGQQTVIQYAVTAVTAAGEGQGAVSDMLCVGTPYSTPFKESFANTELTYDWSLITSNPSHTIVADVADDNTVPGVSSQDGDDGLLYFYGEYVQDVAAIVSGMIAVPAEGPTRLSFYALGMSSDSGNEIVASVWCNGQETVLGTTVPLGNMTWVRTAYDLSAFAGKTIQLKLACVIKSQKYAFIDNITVATPHDCDLALVKLNAPARVKAGDDIEMTAIIENLGLQEVAAYTVDFYMNGQLLNSEAGVPLAPGVNGTVMSTVNTNALTADELEFHAVISYADDRDQANNSSATVKVGVVKPNLPAPTGLTGVLTDGKVELSWDACNGTVAAGESFTEDFETAVTGAHEVEGWTMVDVDGKVVGGIQNMTVPGITAGESKSSFLVFEAAGDFTAASYAAHSGSKYLISMFNMDFSAVSDWAVSPELSGNAQTISFWAKSYSSKYPEKIKVHYTTAESTDPADFVQVSEFGTKTVGDFWTEYSFDVPAGAKRFAIESCAADAFFLMLDDVTYERGGGMQNLRGYNVYYNGRQANTDAVQANAYTHVPDVNGFDNHTYNVTAVYDNGESRPSAAYTVDFSTVGNVAVGLNIVSLHNEIIVTGAAGDDVTVVAVDGKQVAARSGVDSARIKVQSGIYLVTVGQRTVKLSVK